jgi:superfamily II DNA or RNA helicase
MNCVLEISDEVNVRFQGLDAGTRRKLTSAVEFFLPHAKFTPAYKLGRWNGMSSLCDVGGRTYFHLLDQLLPIVMDADYELEVVDRRQKWDLSLDAVQEDSFSHIMWPPKHRFAGQPIMLRDYQVTAINNFLENPQSVQVMATGAGKTIVTAALSERCEKIGRTIVIVPNKDLVVQTEKDYINLGLNVGVLYGDRKDYDRTHTICTWQSLEVMRKKTKAGEAPIDIDVFLDNVVCIMVDEVHKAKADVLMELLTGPFANVPIRWGLTGTLPEEEHEKLKLLATLGPCEGALTSAELQDMGVLARLDISVLQLQDVVREFKNYQEELKWLTTDQGRLRALSDIVNQYAQNGNTLLLIDRIATGDMLAEWNPDWEFVSGATKQADRQEQYDSISDSDNKVIVATYGVAAVGLNIPRIFNLAMLEPGKSFIRVIQSIGRGIRKAEDKDYVDVIDICGATKYSKRHLTKRKKFYKEQKFPFTVTKVKY